jgi:hypothetical protein
MRIGIDIGNVIIGGGGNDTQFFTDDYLKTPELPGAWQALSDLRKDHELHVISKCGPVVEAKSLKWLDVNGFFLSLKMHRIHFVRKRELKAPMAQALELDIFIDDRQDVLDHMVGIVPHLILFRSWEQTNRALERAFDMERQFAASKR